MIAEQHREEGLRLLEKHDYIMAGWEFIHAIDAGDIPSLPSLFKRGRSIRLPSTMKIMITL